MPIGRPPGSSALALCVAGGLSLAADLFWEPGFVLGDYVVQPIPILGALLLATGIILFTMMRPRVAEPAVAVPAHIAFAQRPPATEMKQPRPSVAALSMKPSPQAVSKGPEHDKLSDTIRELTREINRAGVMRATGKLSDEGYRQYVERLKKERAEAESKRLRLEFKELKS